MNARTFKPNNRYLIKLLVSFTLLAFLILLAGLLFAGLIGSDKPRSGLVIFMIVLGLDGLFWLVAMLLATPYFRSLEYEIQDDEVIVRVGILTHSVKHVPYRTVTNLTVKRDILDRWIFNLGSLNIQTAGMSGQTGAEEQLVGLENVQEVYEMVVTELRRFRGGMTPTAAEAEGESLAASPESSQALLEEVQAIRKLLEKGE